MNAPHPYCTRHDQPLDWCDHGPETWHDWYRHAMASVSEGFCPGHRTPLHREGWCPACGTWWHIRDARQVVQTFPPLDGVIGERWRWWTPES